jgi:hypothetical protein
MNIEQYSIISDNSHLFYEFRSIGPRGIIKKYILFQQLNENFFNLSLGDWDELSGIVDDLVVSNNNDTYKVLNTVANTFLQFVHHFPAASVLIVGSTNSRTRLYQMAIGRNIFEIQEFFDLQGFKNGIWEEFKVGINYDAFLVKKKINKL